MEMTLKFMLPLAFFVIIVGFLWKGLYLTPQELPSAMIGNMVPNFQLPTLESSSNIITNNVFKAKVTLANVWATWCHSCAMEHDLLIDIYNSKALPIIGINYKDNRNNALMWLNNFGNPYNVTIFDEHGVLGMDLGVYGTPETFLIDNKGIIRFRQVGPITTEIWKKVLMPEIAKLQN